MAKFKSDIEILKYAIEREKTSLDFYSRLVEQTKKNDVRNLLLDMVREEREHKSRLELELMKQGHTVPDAEPQKGPDDTAVASVLVDVHPEDIKAILLLAIEREHDALRTYLSLILDCRSKPLRETLLLLAEEEARHHALLKIEFDMLGLHRRSHDN